MDTLCFLKLVTYKVKVSKNSNLCFFNFGLLGEGKRTNGRNRFIKIYPKNLKAVY